MTLKDLRAIPLLQTAAIAAACKDDTETTGYLLECISRFYRGDYGEVHPDDVEANNADLQRGEGHILARYKPRHRLQDDIYIESYFMQYAPLDDVNANYTLVMYCGER